MLPYFSPTCSPSGKSQLQFLLASKTQTGCGLGALLPAFFRAAPEGLGWVRDLQALSCPLVRHVQEHLLSLQGLCSTMVSLGATAQSRLRKEV